MVVQMAVQPLAVAIQAPAGLTLQQLLDTTHTVKPGAYCGSQREALRRQGRWGWQI